MKKKGMLLVFVLALLFTFMIMLILFIKLETKNARFDRKLGELQSKTINLYQKADKVLFYIDESARYSANQALFQLGLNGGHHTNPCGTYMEYDLWTTENRECYPDAKKDFVVFFENYFNEYIDAYPGDLYKNNYDFFVNQADKFEVIGVAARNLEFAEETDAFSADYSIKPSFKASIDYNINDYTALKVVSKEMIAYVEQCKNIKPFNVCVAEAKNRANQDLQRIDLKLEGPVASNEGLKIFAFNAESTKKVIAYNPAQGTDYYPVIIKFALTFK